MENVTSPEWQKFIILVPLCAVYTWIAIKNGKGIVKGLKGENHKWDIPEIVVFFWIPLFIGVVLVDVFFDKHASSQVWGVIDSILLFALTGRVFLENQKRKKQKSDTDESST